MYGRSTGQRILHFYHVDEALPGEHRGIGQPLGCRPPHGENSWTTHEFVLPQSCGQGVHPGVLYARWIYDYSFLIY